mmetsp:Transcript_7637/g.15160  ORF Transcript_7637/g.15160 Transcript_7637/m.15160 type:complete len:153 (-) Transcript_7637:1603-2061(-)
MGIAETDYNRLFTAMDQQTLEGLIAKLAAQQQQQQQQTNGQPDSLSALQKLLGNNNSMLQQQQQQQQQQCQGTPRCTAPACDAAYRNAERLVRACHRRPTSSSGVPWSETVRTTLGLARKAYNFRTFRFYEEANLERVFGACEPEQQLSTSA